MPFVSINYSNNANAPAGKWVCTRTSTLGPYSSHPQDSTRRGPTYCGQCVSYVTTVCPTIPGDTRKQKKCVLIKVHKNIADGTAIATFDTTGHYSGHAAIYVSQDDDGIRVYDQWITGTGKAVGSRLIKWNGHGVSNYGAGFYVIES